MKNKKKEPLKKPFTTVHNLPFLSCPWERDQEWNRFKIGTCDGLWSACDLSYDILAVGNDQPGNGHFEDVLQWFEQACRRDGKYLRIMHVWNKRFRSHLIQKRGFMGEGEHCIKKYN